MKPIDEMTVDELRAEVSALRKIIGRCKVERRDILGVERCNRTAEHKGCHTSDRGTAWTGPDYVPEEKGRDERP